MGKLPHWGGSRGCATAATVCKQKQNINKPAEQSDGGFQRQKTFTMNAEEPDYSQLPLEERLQHKVRMIPAHMADQRARTNTKTIRCGRRV